MGDKDNQLASLKEAYEELRAQYNALTTQTL